MNKFILEQLKKTRINLPLYDNNTTQMLIRKSGGPKPSDIEVGHNYLIFIEDYIINEPENFTLSANWNNGTKPPENKMYVHIAQIMGKMIRVNGRSASNNLFWEGWLPRKSITIMEELNV